MPRISPLGLGSTVFIVAQELLVDEAAVLTWVREPPLDQPPKRQKAPSGVPGRTGGEDGGPGSPGSPGTEGFSGRDAPSIVLMVERVVGGELIIDIRGEDGGPGGDGGDGGDGGHGGRGRSASQSLFDCKAGPGGGGNGGPGGNGGDAGPGGAGGAGGSLLLLTTSPDTTIDRIRAFTSSGETGGNGSPGSGGNGGVGGPPGRDEPPFCRRGARAGTSGPPGAPGGVPSFQGAASSAGDFFTFTSDAINFEDIFQDEPD